MRALVFLLLRLSPRPFRERFGDEIAAQVARGLERARRRGRRAAIRYAFATAFDLALSAATERVAPGWPAPAVPPPPQTRRPKRKERPMHSIVDDWRSDLRLAVRTLRRSPGFTVVAAGTLALAIGTAAGVYSVVDAVLLRPFPFAAVDRLVYISASAPGSDLPGELGVSNEFYLHYRERSRLLEEVSTFNSFTNTLRTPERVERIRMSAPTTSLFATLGAHPLLGRLLTDADEDTGVLISDALWQSWFGADPKILGRAVEINGKSRTVVGVMPAEFHFPNDTTLLWLPDVIRAEGLKPGNFGNLLLGRMKAGVTLEALRAELDELARQLPERFGGTPNYARLIEQHRAVVRPLTDQIVGRVARPLWVLFAAAGLVLLAAGANVANLFLVRAESRQRDLAVRRAIGAGRGRLVRLQMAEAVVVAALAGAAAIGLAAAILPALLRAAPPGVPRLGEVHANAATFAFAFAAALVVALVCGLGPALGASAPALARLHESGRGSTLRRRWARTLLVGAQTALALLLLIGSGLLWRSHGALARVDRGYDIADLFTFQIAPERPELHDGPSFARFHLAFLERLAAVPGVESVGLVENIPLNEMTSVAPAFAEGAATVGDGGVRVHFTFTAGDYFRTMGIGLLAGRTFSSEDHLSLHGNALVSRSAAKLLFGDADPLGRRFKSPASDDMTTVVGVVDDVMQNDFRTPAEATVYLPLAGPTPKSWRISSPAYVLKSKRAESIAPEIRALAREVAPEAPMYREFTLAGLANDSMRDLSFTLLVLGIASALSLLLGAVGLYGVLSYVVAQRTREIGLRMALGARAKQVRRMVVVEGARVVGAGIAIGLAAALASTRALSGLLYGVKPADAVTFVAMSAAMLAVGLLASYLPARRASCVEPMEALRAE